MTLAALLATHKAALGPAAGKFSAAADADFVRHLDQARRWLAGRFPRVLAGTVALVAGTARYASPAGLVAVQRLVWGADATAQPWAAGYPGPLPRLYSAEAAGGARELVFQPAPTAAQVAAWGASAAYEYRALHVLADDATHTLPPDLDAPLLLAALIVALRELAARNVVDPITLHRGVGSLPSASTPLELLRHLQAEWAAL